MRVGGRTGGNGAEFRGHAAAEGKRLVASVELAADELELNGQALLVVDDFGLVGHHAHVGGVAVADVVDEQRELSFLAGFDSFGERVIADDVALHEVGEVEVGRGLDGECHGGEVAGHGQAAERVGVGEGAAKAVDLVGGRSGILGGDEQHGCHAGFLGAEGPAGVEAELSVKSVERLGIYLELVGCGHVAVLVRYGELEFDVGHGGGLVAVEHREGSSEGLAGHDHRLGEAQGYAGAYRAAGFLKPVVALVVGGGVHLAGRLIAHQRAFSLATEDDCAVGVNFVNVEMTGDMMNKSIKFII